MWYHVTSHMLKNTCHLKYGFHENFLQAGLKKISFH
jgi:hypothetical protein